MEKGRRNAIQKMKKKTIELFRDSGFFSGYFWAKDPVSEEDILNKLVEFSDGKNIHIYKHLKKIREENAKTNQPKSDKNPYGCDIVDKVIYLDIYYQERL